MKGWLTAVGASAALMLAQSASAQDKASSESDLRCAVWSATIGGQTNDPVVLQAISMSLGWFAGRYEAGTGKPIEQGMTPEFVDSLPDMDVLQAECLPRMEDMGRRFEALGTKLQEADQ